MKKYNPNVYKIAVTPNTKDDVEIIYKLTKYFKKQFIWKNFIFISMWELWKQTRLDLVKEWWLLTFATISWKKSAPWQINYKNL